MLGVQIGDVGVAGEEGDWEMHGEREMQCMTTNEAEVTTALLAE